jgi:hypothetical protein
VSSCIREGVRGGVYIETGKRMAPAAPLTMKGRPRQRDDGGDCHQRSRA